MMDWQRLIDLGVMTPQNLEQARSSALTNALFQTGAAFSRAGAPSRTPGGQPLNLAPVFTNYQNSLANSMKQGLMMKQLERKEEEYKRAEGNRQKMASIFAPKMEMMPTGREIPTGRYETKREFVSDISYEHPQGRFGNLPMSGPVSDYWKAPGFENYDPRQVVKRTTKAAIMEPELEMRETNPNLLALPPAIRRLVANMGPAGFGGQIGKALLTAALKDTRPTSVREIEYLQRQISSLPAGSPQRVALEQRLKKVTTSGGGTTVNIAGDQGKDLSGKIVDRWFAESKDAGIAYGVISNMKRLEQLLDQGVKTGWAQGAMLSLNRTLKTLGLTDIDVSGKEAFVSIITQAAISGAKELGVNPTDKDLELIFQRGAELHKTIEGNRKIIQAYRENARRTIARSNWTDNFVEKNEELLKTNPLSFEIKRRREFREFSEQLYQDNKIELTSGSGGSTTTPGMWK